MLAPFAELTLGNIAVVGGAIATILSARIAWVKLAGETTGQELTNIKNEIQVAWESADRAKAEEAKMRAQLDTALKACELWQERCHELEKRLATGQR